MLSIHKALLSRYFVSGINLSLVFFISWNFSSDVAAQVFTFTMLMSFCSGWVSNRFRSTLFISHNTNNDLHTRNVYEFILYILLFGFVIGCLSYVLSGLNYVSNTLLYCIGIFLMSNFYARNWSKNRLWISYLVDLPFMCSISMLLFLNIINFELYSVIIFLFLGFILNINFKQKEFVAFPKFKFEHIKLMLASQVITAVSFVEVLIFSSIEIPQDIVAYRVFLAVLSLMVMTTSVYVQSQVKSSNLKYSRLEIILIVIISLFLLFISSLLLIASEMFYLQLCIIVVAVIQMGLFKYQLKFITESKEVYLILAYAIILMVSIYLGNVMVFDQLIKLLFYKLFILSLVNVCIGTLFILTWKKSFALD